MTWESLHWCRVSLMEFTPALRALHHIVRLKNGRYSRTLGPPENARHVQGNLWEKL